MHVRASRALQPRHLGRWNATALWLVPAPRSRGALNAGISPRNYCYFDSVQASSAGSWAPLQRSRHAVHETLFCVSPAARSGSSVAIVRLALHCTARRAAAGRAATKSHSWLDSRGLTYWARRWAAAAMAGLRQRAMGIGWRALGCQYKLPRRAMRVARDKPASRFGRSGTQGRCQNLRDRCRVTVRDAPADRRMLQRRLQSATHSQTVRGEDSGCTYTVASALRRAVEDLRVCQTVRRPALR